ncbi:MAG: tRNA (adenosine(37)-N6)-dimethylallyltransferase MiaA [Smithellaceae bacterium]|nr:tRNA (adenosine(37)-N6)-dimethylallyltransferase MiaA [Smithellaceae bacterium]
MNDEPGRPNLIVILGPTASGKTGLAVTLARRLGGEIISADSRQVYRGMNLGTGKDLDEYNRDGKVIPYHLIDVVDPDQEYNLFIYQKAFAACFDTLSVRGVRPILVGGTGMYLSAIIEGYNLLEVPENAKLREECTGLDEKTLTARLLQLSPALHNTTDLQDRARLVRALEIALYYEQKGERKGLRPTRIVPFIVGLRWDRAILRERITQRLKRRLSRGMIDEVRDLQMAGISWERLHAFGLEYRYIALHLQGQLSYEEMFRSLNSRIHQLAKRQETWFRGMEKRGVLINWIAGDDSKALCTLVRKDLA